MKMRTSEMTTALVVDSPTPLAPPLVVKPHEQLTCSHRAHYQAIENATQSVQEQLANWVGRLRCALTACAGSMPLLPAKHGQAICEE